MTNEFRLLMISAMYENGGNTVHRFLDGHPELFVYPFESQLGTVNTSDHLHSLFPVKYRWPVFDLHASPEQDYRAIIDEECKVRARTPRVSKFRHIHFDFSDELRLRSYCSHIDRTGRSRANNVAAFFRASFEVWKNRKASGREHVYVGYSPIVAVDGAKIIEDFPGAHVIHVVRNPWSAYADTKKRAVPLSLERYVFTWALCLQCALALAGKHPDNFHIIRLEDVLSDPPGILGGLCRKIGIESSPSLASPSWNGEVLEEVYPWGTIRSASTEKNIETAHQLNGSEIDSVRLYAGHYLELLEYNDFI